MNKRKNLFFVALIALLCYAWGISSIKRTRSPSSQASSQDFLAETTLLCLRMFQASEGPGCLHDKPPLKLTSPSTCLFRYAHRRVAYQARLLLVSFSISLLLFYKDKVLVWQGSYGLLVWRVSYHVCGSGFPDRKGSFPSPWEGLSIWKASFNACEKGCLSHKPSFCTYDEDESPIWQAFFGAFVNWLSRSSLKIFLPNFCKRYNVFWKVILLHQTLQQSLHNPITVDRFSTTTNFKRHIFANVDCLKSSLTPSPSMAPMLSSQS